MFAAALMSDGRETTAPDVTAAAMRDSSPMFLAARGGCGLWASLPDQGAQPGKQAENGAELPHAPSAPATVERAEPPDRTADVSSPAPSAAEPIDPWRSPAYCLRRPCLAETFC
ncbi:hypothetical protein CHARACLAT_004804 [Characodon lateralis]|uniref:Uncharacterized protein n=1 Tax=Characodon lateralis TaxID=208331 RepID=A0ABU7D754_9TELE|nr:hypothetical protein [Characodon lateralis]